MHLRFKGSGPSLNRKWLKHTNLVVTDSELNFFHSRPRTVSVKKRYPSKTGIKEKTKKKQETHEENKNFSRKNTKKPQICLQKTEFVFFRGYRFLFDTEKLNFLSQIYRFLQNFSPSTNPVSVKKYEKNGKKHKFTTFLSRPAKSCFFRVLFCKYRLCFGAGACYESLTQII